MTADSATTETTVQTAAALVPEGGQEGGWADSALCAQVDPDLFFPRQGRPDQRGEARLPSL